MIILSSQSSYKKHVTIIFIFIYYLIFPSQPDAQLEYSDFSSQKQYKTLGEEGNGQSFMEAENLFHSGKFMAANIKNSKFIPIKSKNHVLLETEQGWDLFKEEITKFLD